MTTYKSVRFIQERLERIFNQTHLLNETNFCSDALTDDKVVVVKEIIKDSARLVIELYMAILNCFLKENSTLMVISVAN